MDVKAFSKFFAVFLCIGLGLGSAFAATKPAASDVQAILRDGRVLFAGEDGADERSLAQARLASRPKPLLLGVLREILAKDDAGEAGVALRITLVLKLTELMPEIEKRVAKRDEWRPVVALNLLSDANSWPRLTKLYLERLPRVSSETTKVALLDGLTTMKASLDSLVYQSLISDSSSDVRRSAFQQFLASRDQYPLADQQKRFALAFAVPSYQGKFRALKAFLALPESERKQLASAVSPSLCKDETRSEVKDLCQNVQRSLGRAPAKEGP
jgi:hypothetical protein